MSIAGCRVPSTKTRIETLALESTLPLVVVAEYLPLKQGLKSKAKVININTTIVAEYLPPKQGLKLTCAIRVKTVIKGCRVLSTKTRTETFSGKRYLASWAFL